MMDAKDHLTLEWVLNPPLKTQWSDIPPWLQGSGGLYWVSGKAGSGKSTLMKWLIEEGRTTKLLELWAGNKRLLIADCFLWSSESGV